MPRKLTEVAPTKPFQVGQLKPGTAFKRLVDSTSYSAAKIRLGVVQSVVGNGEKTFVTALEWTSEYGALDPKITVYGEDLDTSSLFPATAEEVILELQRVLAAAQSAEDVARTKLAEATKTREMVELYLSLPAGTITDTPATPYVYPNA